MKDISYQTASHEDKTRTERALKKTLFAIPSLNGAHLLEEMLPTLKIPPDCIIVIDQGSVDNTKGVCDRHKVKLLQLNTPHTYTQCCNVANEVAHERDAEFLFISNNDIIFSTDVVRELVYEMLEDSNLGALSCSQVIVDKGGKEILSNRVYWDLGITDFEHDTLLRSDDIYRLESDFCELTCAVLRVSAIREIGGFDDGFGFYHEDADIGFRLRCAGYSTAYLSKSQIKHFAGSTFAQGRSKQRIEYINNSRKLFAKKHLGYGLKYIDHSSDAATSWNVINKNLFPYMKRYGLVDLDRPELVFSHPGEQPSECLYSVWETSELPKKWLQYRNSYKSTYLPSKWNFDVFKKAQFTNVSYVPLGVETDIFHPWGLAERQFTGPTFLWFARNQHRKGLDLMLAAWQHFRASQVGCHLVIVGHGVLPKHIDRIRQCRHWKKYVVYNDEQLGVSFREPIVPLSETELACLYRGCDYLVLTSRSEGFGFSIVEAMACGVLTIFPKYGATLDMCYPGSINFDGSEVLADYTDKEFTDVGTWWEPAFEDISCAMLQALEQNKNEHKYHLRQGFNVVRSKFTWRNTCLALRADLIKWQQQKPVHVKTVGETSSDLEKNSIIFYLENLVDDSSNIIEARLATEVFEPDLVFGDFDADFYRRRYADIANSDIMPLFHYLLYGWREEREPSNNFSTRQYIAANRDVRICLFIIKKMLQSEDIDIVRGKIMYWVTMSRIQTTGNENESEETCVIYDFPSAVSASPRLSPSENTKTGSKDPSIVSQLLFRRSFSMLAHIDSVNGNPVSQKSPIQVHQNKDKLLICGWALQKINKAGYDELFVTLTNSGRKNILFATRSVDRNDLVGSFGSPDALTGGFISEIDLMALRPGKYILGLTARQRGSTFVYRKKSVIIILKKTI